MDLAIGLGTFMVVDVLALLAFDSLRSIAAGMTFAGLTMLMAAVIYVRGGRGIGAGLVLGFAVMSLLTGGKCTLFEGEEYGEFGGIFYLLIVAVAFLVAILWKSMSPRDHR